MSRKRESLVDLLHWSRKSSTCDQTAKKEHEDRPTSGAQRDGSSPASPNGQGRPHTSLGLTGRVAPSPSSGSSLPGQPSNGASFNRRGLPPLARAGSAVYASSANGSGNPTAPEQSPDSLTHFQEALYIIGQPHNATSRLLRLGAGSPSPTVLRRSATACLGPGAIPPLPTPQQQLRTLSPATGSSPLPVNAGGTPEDSNGSFLPAAGTPLSDTAFSRQQPLSPRGMARPYTAWTGAGALPAGSGGSPPRSVQRFGSRENSALVEEARRMAQQAAAVLYGTDADVTPADREAASEALLQLESLLGPREVALTKLAHEARSLRAEVGRELHASDKQASFARAQLKALERQHDRLRQQLRPRPEPIILPHTALGPLSDTGTPSISPKAPGLEGLPITRTISGSASAPQSPSMSRIGPPAIITMLGSGTLPPDSPRRWPHTLPFAPLQPSRAAARAAGCGSASASGSGSEGDREREQGRGGEDGRGSANGEAGPGAIQATMPSVVPGAVEGSEAGVSPLGSRWSLAGAMERTLQLRALSRAEAAMQTVAAMRAAEVRPPSDEVGDSGPPVDVEELRRLKHTPGVLDAEDEQPSYIGVTVRRETSPLQGSDSIGGLAMLGSGGAPGAGLTGDGADPRATLQWSNRGISTSKMPLLREVLNQTPQLTRLCLAGNKLANEDVMELMAMLSEPGAPRVNDICLDQNTALTWRCALPLALALGMSPDMAAGSLSSDWAAVAASLPPTSSASPGSVLAPAAVPSARDKVRRLGLRTLSLCGVKLGDKGVAQLAEGLRANHSLRQLDLRRCGISDSGGAVLMEVLESNGQLQRLDVSWNALRSETARALEVALAGNAGLRELSLAHNGFGDCDGARVMKGLLSHGKWLRVDMSHNTVGPGSCMMVGELLRQLGAVASGLLVKGAYTEGWRRSESIRLRSATGSGMTESGAAGGGTLPPVVGTSRMLIPDPSRRFQTVAEGSPPPSPTSVRIAAGQLGAQLQEGQPMLALDGNPLGSTGLRIILDAMEAMGQDMMAAAGLELPDAAVRVEPPEMVPPLPLVVSITGCNVAPPSERSGGDDSGDDANPFLPSIAVLCRPAGGADGRGKAVGAGKPPAGKDAKKPAGKGSGAGPAPGSGAGSGGAAGSGSGPSAASRPGSSASAKAKEAAKGPSKVVVAHTALTLHSPHLDLHSPAGVYNLDLGHPATAILVSYLLRMADRLTAAVEAGTVAAGVALHLSNITVNGRAVKVDQLAASLDTWTEGTLQLTVRAPAVLAVEAPPPLTPLVALWLASLMGDATTSPLWKLSVIQAAGSVCFFTPWQCLELLAGFDRDTQSTECVAAAQMLYARSAQPLAFWEHVLPRMTQTQQQALRERVGDLVALDMNRPMGRYTLNLSRQVDRFVALRLQLASALECSWVENKYFINWLNASFNGQTLDRPGLTRIRDYTLPGAGVLRLDYVSYQKPGLEMDPALPEEMGDLLAALRNCTLAHINAQLQVRALAAPPPPNVPSPSGRRDNARSPMGRRKPPLPPPPPPKPRLTAFQLTHMTLTEVAHVLASPPAPPPAPPPVPDADGNLPPAPAAPPGWVAACGFNPEPLFRRTGVLPPGSCLPGALTGPLLSAISDAAPVAELLPRAMSLTAKSVKSMGGRSSVLASRRGSRRGGKEEEKEEGRDWKAAQAEYHAALLLLVHQAKDLPLLVSKMCPHHLGPAVGVLLRHEGGQRLVAALLAALPPLAASKFLYDQADPSPCLLPAEARRHLIAAMPPERLKLVEVAARGASEAAVQRARRVRTVLNVWASERFVTAEQVAAVMGVLHTEGDRVAAMVVLWPRLVDGRWKKAYLGLTLPEQRQIMTRLGHLHVYLCLGDPHGISFALDLTEPEQRDIARELVRMAVKETARAKQESKARGGFYAATLLELHGNGNPVSIPEDEKLWGMADANFKTMDFLYSPTFEQSLQQAEASATIIQRFWTSVRARRAQREVLVAQGALPLPPATSITSNGGVPRGY